MRVEPQMSDLVQLALMRSEFRPNEGGGDQDSLSPSLVPFCCLKELVVNSQLPISLRVISHNYTWEIGIP